MYVYMPLSKPRVLLDLLLKDPNNRKSELEMKWYSCLSLFMLQHYDMHWVA